MIKVRLLTLMPFSAKFGGAEIQALKYCEYIKKYYGNEIDIDFLDIYQRNINEIDIIHLVEANYEKERIMAYLKAKNKNIIISPVFYKNLKSFYMKSLNKFFSYIPIPNWFKSMNNIYKLADIILPNSQKEYLYLKDIFGDYNHKIIYNGIDSDYFNEVDENLFKNQFGLNKYILSVSMIGRRKNTLRSIQAFLKSQIYNYGYKFVLIGNYSNVDLKYERQVKKLVEENKDKIVFTGFIDRNSELFKSAYLGCDLHILPSILETPGLANLEAALAGKKIIVGDCPPVREYFDGIATFVNPYSVNNIARGIKKALNKNFDKKKQIKYIKDNFSWENIAKQLVKVYKEVYEKNIITN